MGNIGFINMNTEQWGNKFLIEYIYITVITIKCGKCARASAIRLMGFKLRMILSSALSDL